MGKLSEIEKLVEITIIVTVLTETHWKDSDYFTTSKWQSRDYIKQWYLIQQWSYIYNK